MFDIELFRYLPVGKTILNWIVWYRPVYKYKMDLALNNLQWLICHKTKQNQILPLIREIIIMIIIIIIIIIIISYDVENPNHIYKRVNLLLAWML